MKHIGKLEVTAAGWRSHLWMEIVDCLSVLKHNMLLAEVASDNRGGLFEIGSIAWKNEQRGPTKILDFLEPVSIQPWAVVIWNINESVALLDGEIRNQHVIKACLFENVLTIIGDNMSVFSCVAHCLQVFITLYKE